MMSTIGIIILVVMPLCVVVSFWVLFKAKREPNVVKVPSYNKSVNKILNERCKSEGNIITYDQLLDRTEHVLNALQ